MELNVIIRTINPEEFDLIKPLWERLRDHHAENSANFRPRYEKMTFEQRKKNLLDKLKTGKLKIDIAYEPNLNQIVAYCVSSVCVETYSITGEIDSIFIDKSYRNKGLGTSLMDEAMNWFHTEKVNTKKIVVAKGNEDALRFYKKYGFYTLHYILKQKSEF